jgi:hypothetical protein
MWAAGQVSLQPFSEHESSTVLDSILKNVEKYKELDEGEERGGR